MRDLSRFSFLVADTNLVNFGRFKWKLFTATTTYFISQNLQLQIKLQLFDVFNIPFRFTNVKVRVWGSSYSFGFPHGPHC